MKSKQTVSMKSIAGQNILVDLDFSCVNFDKMITVNDTGAVIWGFLKENLDESSLIQKVADYYELPIDDVAKDVKDFLVQMIDLGLIINE